MLAFCFKVPGYLGCYGNISTSWTQLVSNQQRLTVGSCLDACRRGDYPVAALSRGKDCWCGNDGNTGGQELSPEQCNTPCTGNDQEFCGGNNGATSLYASKFKSR